jgi:hypothetical protein
MRSSPEARRPRIYFAGSIRGGRSDREIYHGLIRHLRGFGDVLTEHVGDQKLTVLGEERMPDEAIYRRDIEWIRMADVVIAEVTSPSLGVGYEIACAEALDKPILCLYCPSSGARLSAMVAGNPRLLVREYGELEEASRHLDRFLGSLGISARPPTASGPLPRTQD